MVLRSGGIAPPLQLAVLTFGARPRVLPHGLSPPIGGDEADLDQMGSAHADSRRNGPQYFTLIHVHKHIRTRNGPGPQCGHPEAGKERITLVSILSLAERTERQYRQSLHMHID